MKTVRDLPRPLRDLAWAAGYVVLFGLSVGIGIRTGWATFLEDWKDTLGQIRGAGK
jgi:hypothetical protein